MFQGNSFFLWKRLMAHCCVRKLAILRISQFGQTIFVPADFCQTLRFILFQEQWLPFPIFCQISKLWIHTLPSRLANSHPSKRKCFVDGLLFIWKKYNVRMCQSELSSLQPTKVIWPIEGQWPKSDWIVLDRWALSINWASISNALAGFLHSNTHIHYPKMAKAKTKTNTWQ